MKQAILNLKKKLLLVELPEDATNVKLRFNRFLTYVKPFSKVVQKFDDNIELIGKLTDITESQFAELVDRFYNGGYRDYKDKNSFYPDADTDNFFLSAKESFFSYFESQGVLFENPLADSISAPDIEEWKEEQEKVWILSNCYLFEILN